MPWVALGDYLNPSIADDMVMYGPLWGYSMTFESDCLAREEEHCLGGHLDDFRIVDDITAHRAIRACSHRQSHRDGDIGACEVFWGD